MWARAYAQTDAMTAAAAASAAAAAAAASMAPSAVYIDAATLAKAQELRKGEKMSKRAPPQPGVKRCFRKAAGEEWEDPSLADWPDNDFRIFVGDLGNEVNDEVLRQAFQKYNCQKSRVIRDKYSQKSKGYGFVSFADPMDFAHALKEMNGAYIGGRPCKLKRSRWRERDDGDKAKRWDDYQKSQKPAAKKPRRV
eukprot:m51a1_g8245 putative rna recognition domain containing protein (195) ;mRNA; f:127603-128273